MNLYIIYGHVTHSGDRGWLRTDLFLKDPKIQNRWYSLHPAPNPIDTRPGKVVKYWSNDAPRLNSTFTNIFKPSGLTCSHPSCPVVQDILCKWNKAPHEGTYIGKIRLSWACSTSCSLFPDPVKIGSQCWTSVPLTGS